jgi:translation initiation factor 1
MGKKRDRDEGRKNAAETPGFGSTLGDLLRAKGLAPPEPPAEPPRTETAKPERTPAPKSTTPPPPRSEPVASSKVPAGPLNPCPKVVVRRERKGHGGKTVTRVEGLAPLGAAGVEDVARRLKKALGCGATVEGDDVLVQGDQADRVADWLGREGARKVVRGT